MSNAALAASLPFWFVVGLAVRAAIDDYVSNYTVRHVHRKRSRGAR